MDKDRVIIAANKTFAERLGKNFDDLVGSKLYEILPAEVAKRRRLYTNEVLRTGKAVRFEDMRGGRWLDHFIHPIMNAEGEVSKLAILSLDITERKQAEAALRESEARLAKAEQIASLGYWDLDLKNRKVTWSKEVYRLFAKDPDTFVPTFEAFLEAIHPEDRDRLLRVRDKAVAEGRGFTVDYRIILPNGPPRFMQEIVDISRNGLGNPTRMFGTVQDITERKRTEETLRSTRDYLENLFANSPDGLGIVDRHGKVTQWNKAAEELYGYTFEELKERSAIDLYADPGEYIVMLKRVLRHGFIRNYEINMRKKDGSVFPASLSIRVLHNGDNRIIGSITVCRDLTEIRRTMMQLQYAIYQHEQARRALLESEQKLVNIIDFLPEATLVIDTDGKVIAWNKAIEEMTGIKASDMLGKGNYEYALPFHGERRPILVDLVLEPEKGIEGYYEVKREDRALMATAHLPEFRGKETYLFGKASALIDSHGNTIGSIESIRDITALRKAETDRLQLSKLESMSILAGGIAHDFNNILTTILLNIDLAMMNRKLDKKVIEELLRSEEACFRAKELSGQLLTFAKGGAPLKKVISLVKLVRESAKLALAGSKSLCELSFSDMIWSVEADESQITQVINNFLINADQAMPSGGIIKIEAENIVVEARSELPLF